MRTMFYNVEDESLRSLSRPPFFGFSQDFVDEITGPGIALSAERTTAFLPGVSYLYFGPYLPTPKSPKRFCARTH